MATSTSATTIGNGEDIGSNPLLSAQELKAKKRKAKKLRKKALK